MAKEKDECCNDENCKENYWFKRGRHAHCHNHGGGGGGAVYGLGLIGALFYFLGHAGSFGAVVMGILQSLVWPALFVYHIFTFLKI